MTTPAPVVDATGTMVALTAAPRRIVSLDLCTDQLLIELAPRCPRCGSGRTRMVSRFGSTACKSIYSCQDCLEPFDHFKAI